MGASRACDVRRVVRGDLRKVTVESEGEEEAHGGVRHLSNLGDSKDVDLQ